MNGAINPYLTGFKGNWRPVENKVVQLNRMGQDILTNTKTQPDLRSSGYFLNFSSYWYFNSTTQQWDTALNYNKWITSNYITLYDKNGQELENRDPLGRYSSAILAYKDQLPVAVAANAMKREIYYDGFDDYNFRNLCQPANACNSDNFSIYNGIGTGYAGWLDNTVAHSGKYSLKLNGSLTLTTRGHNIIQRSIPYLNISSAGSYQRRNVTGLYPAGFEPVPSKKYLFSAWVRDQQPASSSPGITVTVNGAAVPLVKKAVVEGWKLVEGAFTSPPGPNDLMTLQISGSTSIRLDDIRIFPYDATLKSYTYDEQTLRVMAEMDENNFATFYEYDDEGSLTRVKKETDRGIMTLKESRSAYHKN
jgi:hypothetical protein